MILKKYKGNDVESEQVQIEHYNLAACSCQNLPIKSKSSTLRV